MQKSLIGQLFFAYTRVSTQKQGVEGVSLEAQERAIREYARRHSLSICQWFEERETAAKRGRPVFRQMLTLLRKGKAQGLIIHKIDRSARNLKDWADLGELVDLGVEVKFATEDYDLRSRGGRLSADIQAVIAADYIRNLREEVKKGMHERVRQGRWPWEAPTGYLNKGKGIKEPDPSQAPLVRQGFELYATGSWSLERLAEEMRQRGLKNTRGDPVNLNRLSEIFNNPFYTGVVRMPGTRELFAGLHEAIVSKALFERVQKLLQGKGKLVDHFVRHFNVFSRLIRCRGCGYNLIAERQKGHVYYRCQTKCCRQRKTLREELLETSLLQKLEGLRFRPEEQQRFRAQFAAFCVQSSVSLEDRQKKLQLRLGEIAVQRQRLVDGYAEGVFTKETILDKQNALTTEERGLRDQLATGLGCPQEITKRMEKFLELANTASDCYKQALPEEKRRMVRLVTSNFEVEHENVFIQLKFPFSELGNSSAGASGGHSLDVPRTWALFQQLYDYCAGKDEIELDAVLCPN